MYRIPVYRVSLVRDSSVPAAARQVISSPDAARDVLRSYLAGVDREHFVVLLVDTKNRIIGINTVSVGSLNACITHPREVFKPAIVANAAAIIVGHNHPSGDPTPSREDLAVTTQLVQAGRLLGIEVLDSLIITEEGPWRSLRQTADYLWEGR